MNAGAGAGARRVAATLVDMARTRIELGATELAEERLRLARQALAATLALFCLGTGLVLAVLALAWWAGPDHAAALLAFSALLLLGLAASAWLRWQRLARDKPPLLQYTLEQLRADAQALAPKQP